MCSNSISSSDNLEMLCSFLGYGNPDTARIILVGYEFGGDPNPEVRLDDYPERVARRTRIYQQHLAESGRNYICLPRQKWAAEKGIPEERLEDDIASAGFEVTEWIQVYFSMAYRRRILNQELGSCATPGEYRASELCSTHELALNLFPIQIPRENATYPERLLKVFGLPMLDNEGIKDLLWTKGRRLELLGEVISDISRRVKEYLILFMGCEQKREELCKHLFPEHTFKEVRSNKFGDSRDRRTKILYHSEDRTIWFAQHPSGGWLNTSVADFIIDEILAYTKKRI